LPSWSSAASMASSCGWRGRVIAETVNKARFQGELHQ
jgi:hypothetical protein